MSDQTLDLECIRCAGPLDPFIRGDGIRSWRCRSCGLVYDKCVECGLISHDEGVVCDKCCKNEPEAWRFPHEED